jgi:hypothetical protein
VAELSVTAGLSLPSITRCFADGLVAPPNCGQRRVLLELGHGDHVADAELLEQAAHGTSLY